MVLPLTRWIERHFGAPFGQSVVAIARRPADSFDGDDAEWTAGIYSLLGDKPKALAWLKRAVALGDHNYPWFQRDKNFNNLRGDPEFERLMREVEGYWKQYRQEFGSR